MHRWPLLILVILFRPLVLLHERLLNYLAYQSFDFEHTWWRLFQKHVVCTNLDTNIYVLIVNFRGWMMDESLHVTHGYTYISHFLCLNRRKATYMYLLLGGSVSTDSRHSYGYQLCRFSHRFVPLFVRSSLYLGSP